MPVFVAHVSAQKKTSTERETFFTFFPAETVAVAGIKALNIGEEDMPRNQGYSNYGARVGEVSKESVRMLFENARTKEEIEKHPI